MYVLLIQDLTSLYISGPVSKMFFYTLKIYKMWKSTTLIFFMLLLFNLTDCLSQETITVSKPKLEIQGENLSIAYDILNTKPGEKYKISLEVTDSKGILINAQSYTGDIGENVEGGANKKIIWNFTSDNIKDEVNINIKIVISKYQEPPISEEIAKSTVPYTRSGLVLQSVALPGLGMSKLKKNPCWITGVAGYGLIAGSIIYNGASKSNYKNFENSRNNQQELSYYKKYENQKTMSLICAIGAATIWVTDFIIVLGSSSKLKDNSKNYQKNKLSLIPDYSINCSAPLLSLKYTF
jgi:hypothetical protein